jgi:DNA-binding MarR family transcriptional regulator
MGAMADIPPAPSKDHNQILLGVLDLVERDPKVTQRSLAKELGIALGLANAYLKRCVHKGLVKVSQVPPRRYAYYLTPQGFSEKSRLTANYLAYSFSFFRQARAQLTDIFTAAAARGQRRLALIGEGDLAEIAQLIATTHPIKICGIVPANGDSEGLAAQLAPLDPVDAVVITAASEAREALLAANKLYTFDRVYVPELLRLRKASAMEVTP